MALFTQDELDLIFNRGFKPAPGYSPIIPAQMTRVVVNPYVTVNAATITPASIFDCGIMGDLIQGSKDGTYDIWFSDVATPSDGHPPDAKGIHLDITHAESGGVLNAYFNITLLDSEGNTIPNYNWGGSTGGISGNRFNALLHNCYICLYYRTDISNPHLCFALKYSCFQDDVLKTDRALETIDSGISTPDQPWYDWFLELADTPWFDPESAAPEMEGGGGGGGFYRISDVVGFPPLPTLDICDTGFISLYQISPATLNALAQYMWDDSFVNTISKLWSDPMQNIISLSIVPLGPELKYLEDAVYIGNVASSIRANRLTESMYIKDFGTVNFKENFKSFGDYAPFQKLQIYLPWIGKRELNPDDYMDGTMHLQYQIDVFSGQCIAHLKALKHGKEYVVDSYNGNVSAQFPITGANFASMYQASINGLMTMMSGTVGGLIAGASQQITAKPTYEKSGTLSGNNGRFGVKTPYIFFDTPQLKESKGYRKLHGYPSNMYEKLGNCTGYVEVKYMDINGINAPEEVKDRILQKLHQGIHIHEVSNT